MMRAAISGEFELVTSPAVLTEVAEKLESVLAFDREHTEEVVRQIARVATIVRPTAPLGVIADEADNRILEAAIEGSAEIIVSGDRHLLELVEWSGIRVMRVAEFLHG